MNNKDAKEIELNVNERLTMSTDDLISIRFIDRNVDLIFKDIEHLDEFINNLKEIKRWYEGENFITLENNPRIVNKYIGDKR